MCYFAPAKFIVIPDHPTSQKPLRWRLAQWLERRWWRHYLARKDPAGYLADKRKYWQSVLDQLEYGAPEDSPSLDAGCGPAGIFVLLHGREQMTALDPLLEDYQADLAIFSREDYPAVNFLAAPLETADLPPARFRTIYCFNAINHVKDWELAFDRLTEWAAPGCTMLVSSDVHRRRWLKKIFRWLPGDLLHPQQHDVAAYRGALRKRGWRIERELPLRTESIFQYVAWRVVLDSSD